MTFGAQLARALMIASSLIAVPQLALADDEIRASADIAPTVGYATNPFAEVGSDLGSPFVQIDVQPLIRVIAQNSVIAVSGDFDIQHYLHHYADTNGYVGAADYTGNPTSRLSTHARIGYSSRIVGGFDNINTAIDPTLPPVTPTTGTDLALFGTKARQTLFKLSGGAGYTLSDDASVTANGYYDQSRYGSVAPQSNYNGYGGGLGYSRKISDHLQLGAQASVDHTVYQGAFGHSDVYSLQATINDHLSDRWTLAGAAGASYSQRTMGGNMISPTGNLQLCRVGPRSSLCATVTEAVLPTGFSGTQVTQSADANYSYKLSEHSTFSLAGSYSRNKTPNYLIAGDALPIASSYFTVSASYDRTLRERLHFLATTQYRVIYGDIGGRPTDFSGTVGFVVKLGDYK